MAGDIKTKNVTAANITITLASLANNGARQSAIIDFGTNNSFDGLITVRIRTGASGVSSTGTVNLYWAGSVDSSTWPEGAGSGDAAITLTSPPNFPCIGIINAVANASSYGATVDVANNGHFRGSIPRYGQLIVENKTGGTFDATEGNHAKVLGEQLAQYT